MKFTCLLSFDQQSLKNWNNEFKKWIAYKNLYKLFIFSRQFLNSSLVILKSAIISATYASAFSPN